MTISITIPYKQGRYAECRYAKHCVLCIVMLIVIMLSVAMLIVIKLSVVMPNDVAPILDWPEEIGKHKSSSLFCFLVYYLVILVFLNFR
jgi:hypothetical protein